MIEKYSSQKPLSVSDRIFAFLERLGKITGAVTFLIAPWYALYEYNQKQLSEKVKQVVALNESYNKDPIRESIIRIQIAFVEKAEEIFSSDEGNVNEKLLDVFTAQNLMKDFIIVSSFYSSLRSCVKNSFCDKNTTIQLFTEDAKFFYQTLFPVIERQRRLPGSQTGESLQFIASLK